jgi:hypothetical protein
MTEVSRRGVRVYHQKDDCRIFSTDVKAVLPISNRVVGFVSLSDVRQAC